VKRPEDSPALPNGGARARLWRRAGVVALAAVVVTGALLAPGFDEREVAPDDPSVWALQSVEGQRFARVNTVLGEVDTVKAAEDPTDLAQSGQTLLVYSDNLGSVTPIDTARPIDIDAEAAQSTVATPVGTDAIAHSGDYVAYLTDTGRIMAGRISDGSAVAPIALDPFAAASVEEGEPAPEFRASALAVSPRGDIAAYSAQQGAVVRASAETGLILGIDEVVEGPDDGDLQMTWVGDTWVLYDPATGLMWLRGGESRAATGAEASGRVQEGVEGGQAVLIADEFGVVEVPLGDGEPSRIFGEEQSPLGDPAAPARLPNSETLVAAWLPGGLGGGTLWRSDGSTSRLEYGGLSLDDQRDPQLRSNGSRLILNESRSGWVWSVPSGELVSSSQRWDQDEDIPTTDDDQDVATEVTDPRAPIAVDDEFGVRAGRQVALPVLLNDHDANKDVLTVLGSALGTLDPAFGTLSLADDDQSLIVTVSPTARGVATFTYVITDGTTADGLVSEPATVTLRVKDPSVNSAPQWCGVDGCLTTWPAPQVSPGGTVSADVLPGWVDPEGDPIYLKSARSTSTVGVVAASPEGTVVFQHANANATGGGTVPIGVTVSDALGAEATKTLTIGILDEPELRVEDLSVTVVAGVTTRVAVTEYVTGAVGPLQVTEASLAPGDSSTVAAARRVVGFTFVSDEVGSHSVTFKVSDGVSEARGVARVIVVAPEAERIATVPVTAFVRTKEDATVDVLKAVSNPGGRVLLISDVTIDPASGARLSADVVGFSALRLSGETADAQPGTLGVVTYTVSDGTGRPEMTATGQVTVVLLGAEVPTQPIAVDDNITVRVGTQVDVSVLANDIGPSGSVIALDPDSVTSPDGAGLAFGAGSLVRYLAPNTAGTYVIDYETYVLGYPAQRDAAQLVIKVLDDPTNAAPLPRNLTGRVASGETARLAFDSAGLDPDGDKVSLQRVETQPVSGIASVAADGLSITYTSEPGFSGQVDFTYSVIDARGQTAIGTATVGVIAVELEARPVTYADYVQAQVGTGRSVVVIPTDNDIDLAGGVLSLVDLSPDAPLESDEYRELADNVVSVVDGVVTLSVGELPGTYSYLYTVRNDSGSTAVGRIILKAVREPVADVPIITDTVLALDTRESLPGGVDVLTGKVAWASGDPAGLTLSLWGTPSGLRVEGWTIIGAVTDAARIIPFSVSGLNFAGETVTSYGFLRVPGLDESRLSLKEVIDPPTVVEGESVTFDLVDLVAVPADAQLIVDANDVAASGVRPGSICELVSGTTIRYTASEGAPYSDMCRIGARISDQDRFTLVPVPIVIVPKEPSPILRPASIEVSPGETAIFDLAGMVTWPAGAAARPVDIALTYSGQQFEITRAGDVLTVTAMDRSVPGNVDGATVSLPSDPEVAAVSLSFTVGPAPSVLPKGASIVRQCSQASGASCSFTVIGAAGEVNPLPGTPLEVTAVTPDPNCPTVAFAVNGTSGVTASWTADSPGATCTATFAVRDAQGRISAGDRLGTISLDLQGFPANPSEVRQVAFGDGTLTLAVSPSVGGVSYPSVTGYAIYEGATKVATCGADGSCPAIVDLENGVKHTYTAKAVNSVGESRGSASVVAWAYAPPLAPENVTWTPTRSTGGQGERIDIELDVVDATTSELRITSPNGETQVVPIAGKGHKSISAYVMGSNTPELVTITPVTSLELPPIDGAQAQGAAVSFLANGVGKPTITGTSPTVSGLGTSVSIVVDVASGGTGSETWVGVLSGGVCTGMVRADAGSATVSSALTPNVANRITVCAESRFNGVTFAPADPKDVTVYPWVDPGAPSVTTGYRVDTTCIGDGLSCSTSVTGPEIDMSGLPPTVEVLYTFDSGTPNADFSTMPLGVVTEVRAFFCVVFDAGNSQCSESGTTVNPEPGYANYRTQVVVSPCAVGEAPTVSVAGSPSDWTADWTLLDENGVATSDFGLMRTAQVTVSFNGALQGIADWASDTVTCTGAPDPDPDPSVSPTP
jgi:hypothetical protein